MTTTRLRILRLKYEIPLTVLARTAGVSSQHLSRIELATVRPTLRQEKRVAAALEELILQRRTALAELEKDFLADKGRLLEPLEVEADEL